MEISDRVRKIMEFYGYTSSEFADTIDVPRSSISHITSGRNKPSLDFLTKVKNRFPELQWPWIIDGQGEMTKEQLSVESSDQELKTKPADQPVLPDLFNIEEISMPQKPQPKKPEVKTSESFISAGDKAKPQPDDSQPLGKKPIIQTKDNEIKRIVFFFKDGTFETYEN